jgi:hypothetical protein
VAVSSLQGNTKENCKKGKADGIVKAVGEDSYVGSFRSGYLNGNGKYVWKNGNYYEGDWKSGLRDGKGVMI